MHPDPVCIGDTITFTVSGVVDNGGIMREDCTSKRSIDPVTPTYTWEITRPVPFVPVTGSGAAATVLGELPGEHSCTFTATANRECEPPPIDIGPVTATVATSMAGRLSATECLNASGLHIGGQP